MSFRFFLTVFGGQGLHNALVHSTRHRRWLVRGGELLAPANDDSLVYTVQYVKSVQSTAAGHNRQVTPAMVADVAALRHLADSGHWRYAVLVGGAILLLNRKKCGEQCQVAVPSGSARWQCQSYEAVAGLRSQHKS